MVRRPRLDMRALCVFRWLCGCWEYCCVDHRWSPPSYRSLRAGGAMSRLLLGWLRWSIGPVENLVRLRCVHASATRPIPRHQFHVPL